MNAMVVLSAGGGAVALVTAVIVVGRGIFRMVGATEENTRALNQLTGKVDDLFRQFSNHETRITVLEDRIKR